MCVWCVSCLVYRTEGDIGLVLEPVILWRLKGFPVLYVTYTVNPLYYICCRLPSYLTLSLTKSSPTPLLTICSLCTTHTSLFSPPITPSCHHHHHHSVRVTDSPTLLLIFCSLFPWFHLFLPPLLPPFIPSSIFFSKSFHTPREKHRFDKHWESGTNQSIDLSMYPLLCPYDCQQKTKCLLSETFPISFLPPPHPSPLHCLPHLLMESLFRDLSTLMRLFLVFQLHFFSKVTPVMVPNFCISSLSSLTCPHILPI